MLKINLDRIFRVKGIDKPNQFLQRIGNSPAYASHLVQEKVTSIRFDKLEKMCIDLNCTPNDLFDYIPNKQSPLPPTHALHSISKTDAISEVNKLLHDLPLEKIEQLYTLLKQEKP